MMKILLGTLSRALIVGLVLLGLMATPARAGTIVAWNRNGEVRHVPEGDDFVAIDGGTVLGVAMRADGSLVAWHPWSGVNYQVPEGNDFVAVSAGGIHGLALKEDGSVVVWEAMPTRYPDEYGNLNVPEGNDFVAIGAGALSSMALKEDGTLIAWGGIGVHPPSAKAPYVLATELTSFAVTDSIEDPRTIGVDQSGRLWSFGIGGLLEGDDFVSVAVGSESPVALREDGTLGGMGEWSEDFPFAEPPPPGDDFVSVAASSRHGLALRQDGSLAAWGEAGHEPFDYVLPGNDYVTIACVGGVNMAIVVPEPATLVSLLSAVGVLLIGGILRRRK